jgi:hypothetical protein
MGEGSPDNGSKVPLTIVPPPGVVQGGLSTIGGVPHANTASPPSGIGLSGK